MERGRKASKLQCQTHLYILGQTNTILRRGPGETSAEAPAWEPGAQRGCREHSGGCREHLHGEGVHRGGVSGTCIGMGAQQAAQIEQSQLTEE